MNDFDKIFSEKLHNHKTPPPANGWDQLNAALDKEQNAKKKIIYWRVAAVILLLLTSGIIWWGTDMYPQNADAPLADKPTVNSDVPQLIKEDVDSDTNLLALEDNVSGADQSEKQTTETKNAVPKQSVLSSTSTTTSNVVKQQHAKLQQTQPVMASKEISEEENDVFQSPTKVEPVETLAVVPLAPIAEEPLAMEMTATKVSSPVTIIYKPGSKASVDDDKGLALALLNDLKNTSISFSDIRSAKTELLAKVFSKKENEVTP